MGGKSLYRHGSEGVGWDHPRVGGEKPTSCAPCPGQSGSPPRGRGKGCSRPAKNLNLGITPAWAGKRMSPAQTRPPSRDHPRVGGEKSHRLHHAKGTSGSPPRGRGKGGCAVATIQGGRITPAWAGKSRWCARGQTRARDHPRVGGEKSQREGRTMWHKGSPPRGRGKGPSSRGRRALRWITSAWAGKRGRAKQQPFPVKDHPRVGGEKMQ